MQNFISFTNPTEIVIGLYHPKLYHLYGKFKRAMDFVIKKCPDEGTKKLYEHLPDIDTGLTLEGFQIKCESLGFAKDVKEAFCKLYGDYCALEGDDYKSLAFKIKNYLINEEIKYLLE